LIRELVLRPEKGIRLTVTCRKARKDSVWLSKNNKRICHPKNVIILLTLRFFYCEIFLGSVILCFRRFRNRSCKHTSVNCYMAVSLSACNNGENIFSWRLTFWSFANFVETFQKLLLTFLLPLIKIPLDYHLRTAKECMFHIVIIGWKYMHKYLWL
jgi:hypothetical protein